MPNTTINFIGTGRLGKTLAKLIHNTTNYKISHICNTSITSSKKAISWIGAGTASKDINNLPPADITFITTPDQHIQTIAATLVNSPQFKPQSIIVHCSGALTADVLRNNTTPTLVASAHPLHSFANPEQSINNFPGTYCTLEGDPKAVNTLTILLQQLGANCSTIQSCEKIRYHAAAVIASNYLVTISHHAIDNLIQAGIEPTTAKNITDNLMRGTLDNVNKSKHCSDALTGPLQRGDTAIISQHLQTLDGESLELYQQLGKATLPLTKLTKKQLKELYNQLHSSRS